MSFLPQLSKAYPPDGRLPTTARPDAQRGITLEIACRQFALDHLEPRHRTGPTFRKESKGRHVWINTHGYTDARLPWGGVRDSGFGREHGTAAIENLTEPKTIWMNLNV
jgi:hypothetical protein